MTEGLAPELRQKWAAARVWAAHQAPYLATALLALQPVVVTEPGHDLRRLPADPAWRVYLDPTVLADLEVPVLGFWLLHQVTHLLRDHANRYPGSSGQRDPLQGRRPEQVRWNAAADAEIDDDLSAGAVTVPPNAIRPADLQLPDGWVAEQYWEKLDDGHHDDGDGDCGSGCDGQERGWCVGAGADPSSTAGEGGLGRLGGELVRRDAARRIEEHIRLRGDVPAGWRRWAAEVLAPTVNWRRQLAAAVRRGVAEAAGRVDFTYRRPSRRASSTPDIVLPSLRQPLPQVAIVLDTSGSMSEGLLAQALGEVNGVLRSLGLGRRNLRLICCDAEAYSAQQVLDARTVRLFGGGGTDMGAGLAAAAQLRPRPDLVIVLTDGHTPWPVRPPPQVRVVVGLMDPTGRTPDWATTVAVEAA
jgi:predicted metal-dependent peptidase